MKSLLDSCIKTKYGKSSQIKKRLSGGALNNGRKPNGNLQEQIKSPSRSQEDTQEKHALDWLEPLSPKEIIEDELVRRHKMEKCFVLYSGGQDSGCVDDFMAREFPELYQGRIFTNTGMGSPITRDFALKNSTELCRPINMTWGKKTYYQIVVEEGHGFPTPRAHPIIMGYLKFHSWYDFLKPQLRAGEKACFISGVRKKESWARDKKRFYTKTPIDVNATLTFCKPFLYKNGIQLHEYFIKNGVKKSPAYNWFDKSGECWCGCYYNNWELKMLETYDPFIFSTIQWLENEVQKKIRRLRYYDIPKARRQHKAVNPLKKQLWDMSTHSKWGGSVGAEQSRLQTTFSDFEVNEDYCGESCVVA